MSIPNGLQGTEDIALYLRRCLAHELGEVGDIEMPHWPLDLLEEVHYNAKLVSQAIKNKNWSVNQYLKELKRLGKRCTGTQPHVETELRARFPPKPTQTVAEPCVVVDSEDIILLWFLPGLLNKRRMGLMWDTLSIIQHRLKVIPNSTSWRVNRDFYQPPTDCIYKPGSVSWGLAWYQQAMKGKRKMEVGAELRNPVGRAWVAAMEETNMLLGGVTGLIHPTTFATGSACIRAIGENEHIDKRETLAELLKLWTSPFPAASIINNRNSPLHRDNGGTFGSMDVLTSVGPFQHGKFMVPSLGYEFLFKSGTLIGLLGRIVPHAATVQGERLCYAQYLRENIQDTLGVEHPAFVKVEELTFI